MQNICCSRPSLFAFIDDLIVGSAPKPDEADIGSVITSKNTVEAIQQKVQNIVENHSQQIDQSITVNKNIHIDCGDGNLTDYHLQPTKHKYTWFGEKIPGTGCISYGCCYDVSQSSQITLSSVNSTVLSQSTEVWNQMTAELDARVQATIDPSGPASVTYQEAKNTAKNLVIEDINKSFETLVNTDYEGSQDIVIKEKGPLVCLNSCDEPPTAGQITQSINIDMATKNIVSSFVSSVHKNIMDISLESDVSVTNIDITQIYIFCVMSVSCCLIVFYIGTLICVFVPQLKKCGTPKIGGIILLFIVFHIWKVISCLIRGENIFSCYFR